MIVRIMGVGQFRLADSAMAEVNAVDDKVEAALAVGDEEGFQAALGELAEVVQRVGTPLADDEFLGSDIIVPDSETTIQEAGGLLSEEGVFPN